MGKMANVIFRVCLLILLLGAAIKMHRAVTKQVLVSQVMAAIHAQIVEQQNEQTQLLRLICVNTVKAVTSAQVCVTPPLTGPVPR